MPVKVCPFIIHEDGRRSDKGKGGLIQPLWRKYGGKSLDGLYGLFGFVAFILAARDIFRSIPQMRFRFG